MYKKRGFTLIELLIVIAIIGILSTIVMVAYSGLQTRSRDSKRKGDLQAMSSGANLYYADNKSYPGGKIDGSTNQAYKVSNIASDTSAFTCDNTSVGSFSQVAFTEWSCLTIRGYIGQWPSDPLSSRGYSYYVMGKSTSPPASALGTNSTGYKIMSDPSAANDSFETSGSSDPATCKINAGEFADPATDLTTFGDPVSCTRLQVSNSTTTANYGIKTLISAP